jgi:hypothetical protein
MGHEHYIGAAQSFEIINSDSERPDVALLKVFYIDDTVNINKWKGDWEGLKKDAKDIPGIPLVLQEDLQHPKFSVQEYFDRGTVYDYEIDEINKKIIVYVRITDRSIVERIKSGELQYVSPAVVPRGSEYLKKVDGVDVLERTIPVHLAIVGDPAYGMEKAKMSYLCTGDPKECDHRLRLMTAAKAIYDAETYDDKEEFQGKSCKDRYATIKDGKVRVDWSGKQHQLLHARDLTHSHVCVDSNGKKNITRHGTKKASVEEYSAIAHTSECVSKKIQIIKNERPNISNEQAAAIAYSMCKGKDNSKKKTADHSSDGIKSDLKFVSDTGIPSLEQTPLIRKFIAKTNKMSSKLDQVIFGMKYPILNGVEGRWIKAREQDVFVARNQSVMAAISSQCGCAKIASKVKTTKEAANYRDTTSKTINCVHCKYFNKAESRCSVVEGNIVSGHVSDLFQEKI